MAHRYILLVLATLLATTPAQAAGMAGVIRWHGWGAQIYVCETSPGGYVWVLRRPDATLTDFAGRVRGHHGAGSSWTATDGSRIVGQPVTIIPAPRPDAVPWLVLKADTHDGHGVLNGVTYVLGTETAGGVAPTTGCDPDHAGAVATIPYQATYSFLHLLADPRREPGSSGS
jgi:hypothetical protein